MKLKNYRLISQIFFFTAFLYLLNRTEYTGDQELAYPVRLFLDINPLITITTFLTTYTVPLLLWLSVFTVILTLVFGRFFCGWVCPFGSINHFASYVFDKVNPDPKRGRYSKSQKSKYVILFVVLGSSLAGLHLVGILDPISLVIRSFTVGILPVLNFILRAIIYPVLSADLDIVDSTLIPIFQNVKGFILSHEQTFYWQGFFIFSLFIVILILNMFKNRFFCRVLCPLGALLGILSKYSILELDQSDLCDSCLKCVRTSQGGARPYEKDKWKKTECVLCMNCVSVCDRNSLKFRLNASKGRNIGRTDVKRRAFIASFLSGALATPFVKLTPGTKTYNPKLIRPPGSLPEKDFLKTCIKCEECMKVCLTNVLQPTFLESGPEGLWSPLLDMKTGYCEFKCTLCGQVCPTGAIKELPVEIKKKVKIGLAFVDRNRCLPFAFDIPCIVCEEHCPTSPKAIKLENIEKINVSGEKIKLQLPHVIPDICTGCGICEYKCPVVDKPAIRVTSLNEDRHPGNKPLLEKKPTNNPYSS